ncbi:hypothetical protein BZA77DRAFT_137429 [Pyronema omphalodes]|nr:hypothetical protein BZA77DRAFT_137429 [Pyronema omphalodes]
MAQDLAAEILRVVTSPYAVSLINLEAALKAVDCDDISLWAHSNPCQITTLVRAVLGALEYCPYALSVVKMLAGSERLQNEILDQKPIILADLMRTALQDTAKFDKYSPVLIGLLSSPLPSRFSPPSQLVPFFLQCLDRAIATPSITTIRPLYILVANGYNHLTLQMTEVQSHTFSSRMASLLQAPKTISDMNLFLMYCLTTLAYMYMASTGGKSKPFSVLFDGKKAPWVLSLIIPIVHQCTSSETQIDLKEKVQITQMATVVAQALSHDVKVARASEKDKINVYRLLEKAKSHQNIHLLSEVLQFISALSLIVAPTNINSIIQDLLCRAISEGRSRLVLPLMTKDLCTTLSPLIPTVLQSICGTVPTHGESTSVFLQDHIDFVKSLCSVALESPTLRRQILAVASRHEIVTFVTRSITMPGPAETCSGACCWAIYGLHMKLQQALSSLILQCGFHSTESLLSPTTATKLMDHIVKVSSISCDCPFQRSLMAQIPASMGPTEGFASQETRISSSNWRVSLHQVLSRDSDRQHNRIVSAVSEICRDFERRCENIEEPLQVEKDKVLRIKSELEHYKSHLTELNEQLEEERKNSSGIRKRLDVSLERIGELEDMLKIESEERRRIVTQLEKEALDAKMEHSEEIKLAKETADRSAMEHFAVLNERQEKIYDLEDQKNDLERKFEVVREELVLQKEERARLETTVETQKASLMELKQDLHKKKSMLERVQEEKREIEERLHKRIAVLETELSSTRGTADGLRSSLEKTVSELKEKYGLIGELTHDKKHLESQHHELQQSYQNFEAEQKALMEKIIKDNERKHYDIVTEMQRNNDQKLLDLVSENREKLASINNYHEAALEELRNKFRLELSDRDHNNSMQIKTLISDHAVEYGRLQEKLDIACKDNCLLKEKIKKLHAVQEERAKEAQNLGLKLMGLMADTNATPLHVTPNFFISQDLEPDPTSSPTRHYPNKPPTTISTKRIPDDTFTANSSTAKRIKTQKSPIKSMEIIEPFKSVRQVASPGLKNLGNDPAPDGISRENVARVTPLSPIERDCNTAPTLMTIPNRNLEEQSDSRGELCGIATDSGNGRDEGGGGTKSAFDHIRVREVREEGGEAWRGN